MAAGETYNELKKFEKKTTMDNCYTPTKIYEAVKGWTIKRFNIPG